MNYTKSFGSFLLLFISFSINAKTIESIEYKYYEISPRAPHEIKPELMRRSPIRDGGGSFNGHTDWYVSWDHQSTPGPHGCQLSNIKTTVHVVHILPKLSDYVTDKRTIEVFNKFNAALTQHEKNHGKNGLTAAREMDTAFNQLQPQQNCQHMSRMVNDIGKAIIQKYIEADREYDRVTNNGLSEGAVIY